MLSLDCGIQIHREGKTRFTTPPNMLLCFIKLKKMSSENRHIHESDSFLVTDIRPDIDFVNDAHLKRCPYKKLESTSYDERELRYFFKHFTRTDTRNEFQDIDLFIKSNEIWGLWRILSDFEQKTIKDGISYAKSQLQFFKEEKNTHFEKMYKVALKMMETHAQALESLEMGNFAKYKDLVIKYYQYMNEFISVSKQKEIINKNKQPIVVESNYTFNTPSIPDEYEFQKKILVFAGLVGLGYWAVRALYKISRNKLEPVLDKFISNYTRGQKRSIIPKSRPTTSRSKRRIRPKSSSKHKYPIKISKKSKSSSSRAR
jgi:hypothetical protein